MKRFFLLLPYIVATCFAASGASVDEDVMQVKVNDMNLISYQVKPISNPKGGDKFKGSNFIHPLRTPSGFAVTDIQPSDHLHHFGLWWPWKYLDIEGRKVLCWELQKGDGIVQAQESNPTPDGFTARSVYIDRKSPGGPQELIKETLNVKTSEIVGRTARGYHLDLQIIHEVAIDKTITVSKYRYSGFTLRGARQWNNSNSSILTSEGKDRDTSNFSRARWVRVEGEARDGAKAGVLLMSCTDNYDHPELLRTWNSKMHNGSIFINFNSVQNKAWVFESGKMYSRNFRVFVYDGTLSTEEAEKHWQEYIRTRASTATHSPAASGSM